jgi:hypothetical protein
MKVRREWENVKYISGTQQNVSRGEIGHTMSVMADHVTGRVPAERIRTWFGEERLPADFKPPPPESVGFLEIHKKAQEIGKKIDDLAKETTE